jgi:hypothetical protein
MPVPAFHGQCRHGFQDHVVVDSLAIGILKLTGTGNIAAACRHYGRDATRTLATPGLTPA